MLFRSRKGGEATYRCHFQQQGPYVARSRFKGFPASIDTFKFSDVESFLVGDK